MCSRFLCLAYTSSRSISARRTERRWAECSFFLAGGKDVDHIKSYSNRSLTFCNHHICTLEWCTIILPKCPHLLVLNLTIFQVFVSLRQNDQELASMYDQVILNIWIPGFLCFAFTRWCNSFIPPLFSSESHGQPQKLYGRSDGGGESCPRGQNFGKIQFIYMSCRLSVLSSLIP